MQPHSAKYDVTFESIFEESEFENTLNINGGEPSPVSLSEDPGSTATTHIHQNTLGSFDLTSAGDPAPDTDDAYTLYVDDGDGALDSDDELLSSGDLATLDFQEILQASQNGVYDVILGVEDQTDGDTNDLVALVGIDRLSKPGGDPECPKDDHDNCADCGPDGEGIAVFGTPGRDIIVGTNCDDLLRGRSGDDGISGGRGDDNIGGGRGRDQLVGGAGDDIIVFGSNTGRDVIRDFGNGNDLIDVSRLNINFDDVKQRTNADGDTVVKFDGFTGPDAPKIVLSGVDFLDGSDFIF